MRDENDDAVVKHIFYRDWHRVERAIALFAIEADTLRGRGWEDDPSI